MSKANRIESRIAVDFIQGPTTSSATTTAQNMSENILRSCSLLCSIRVFSFQRGRKHQEFWMGGSKFGHVKKIPFTANIGAAFDLDFFVLVVSATEKNAFETS